MCGNGAAEKAGIDMENRNYRVGEHVIYVDKWGCPRDALITIWWFGDNLVESYLSEHGEPGCNLAFVSGDPKRDDSCGRQTERETSVVHKSHQPAHGCYWCREDELDDGQRARLNTDRVESE